MIIDFHTHVGVSLFGHRQTPDELMIKMDELGIDGSVICPFKPSTYDLTSANYFIAAVVAEYPDTFIGFARVDPWQKKDALEELQKCIETYHLKGLYLDPLEEVFQINNEIVHPLIEQMQKYKMPVMINGGHTRFSTAWQIADLASKFPKVNFIATSGGQINISGASLWESEIMLTENPNIYMETSGIYREDYIEDMVKKLGKERVVFGSNSPFYDLRMEIQRIHWAHITDDEKQSLIGENAERILLKL